jgi:hypothetical protein
MTINHQFGDVDARGATIRAQAASREPTTGPSFRDVLAAGDLHERANAHGQKVQRTRSNLASTDGAVGPSWA